MTVKVPEIIAYFIGNSENKSDAILALIQGAADDSCIANAVENLNGDRSIGITEDGLGAIISWIKDATTAELLGLVNGWEVMPSE